jgi:hypothetical protein
MIKKALGRLLVAATVAFAAFTAPAARAYTIDTNFTSASRVSGLWYNPAESGWGVTFEQQANVIFVTMFTYDAARNPIWYVASNCAVSGGGCAGDFYRVSNGSSPTSQWSGSVGVTRVGTFTVQFSDINNGSISYSIHGESGSKQITRQLFAGGPSQPPPPPVTNDRRDRTERLIGGTWSMVYTLITTWIDRFTFTTMAPPTSDGDYLAVGTDQYGGAIGGGWVQDLGSWLVVNPGSIIDEIFNFDFSDLNHVSGCYYQMKPPGSGNLTQCVRFTGTRSPAKSFTLDLTPGAREAVETAKQGEASVGKSALLENVELLKAYQSVTSRLKR